MVGEKQKENEETNNRYKTKNSIAREIVTLMEEIDAMKERTKQLKEQMQLLRKQYKAIDDKQLTIEETPTKKAKKKKEGK